MMLAINIGNSNVRFGVFNGLPEPKTWTVNTKPYKSEDEYFSIIKNLYDQYEVSPNDIEDIVIGSVVPAITHTISDAIQHIHGKKPVVVDRYSPSAVKHESNQMGTDLYANAVAAHGLSNGKKIIIDFGTALTFTAIDAEGQFLGVIIAPGVNTSLNSLIGETAQLPDIELKMPPQVLGKDTESCMQSGLINGFTSLVEGMVDRINEEVGESCFVIATGGLGHIFAPLTDRIQHFDRLHTIKGLKQLYLNQKG